MMTHATVAGQPLTLAFAAIRRSDLPLVGGKGANLGELTAAGFAVPAGFCVTTWAFQAFMAEQAAEIYALLATLAPGDVEGVRVVGAQVRARLTAAPIPPAVAAAVTEAWAAIGADAAFAVRSSATAEDLPDASFAGQQDTYLNVRGAQALLDSVRRCWASLFTDRAILYRMQNHFEHREVSLSVVVQRMIPAEVSGIMFTADPVTGRRHTVSIDASYGLGEALVSGLVTADLFKVDVATRQIIQRQIGPKQVQIRGLPDGGVEHVPVADAERERAALTDAQVLELADLGAQIEAHYGAPQDIEWALSAGHLYVLQARPITSLYPLPADAAAHKDLRVYVSFNHFQVMTDPMPELSLSLWRAMLMFGRPRGELLNPFFQTAGGRGYIDVSLLMRHPVFKHAFPKVLNNADRLVSLGVQKVAARPEFQAGPVARTRSVLRWIVPIASNLLAWLFWRRPEGQTAAVLAEIEARTTSVSAGIAAAPTAALRLKGITDELAWLLARVAPTWPPRVFAGFLAQALVGVLMRGRVSRTDVQALARGLEGNVTTDMDLAVGDLADLVRARPELLAHLQRQDQPATELLAQADQLPGGAAFLAGWQNFMCDYGMRGPSEIDPRRLRWAEDPTSLLQMVLGNAQHGTVGAHREHHRQLQAAGTAAAERIVAAAGGGLLGWLRKPLVRRLTRVARELAAIREHPKFLLVKLLWLFKQVALEAGAELVAAGRLAAVDDVWFLTLPELQAALAATQPLQEVVAPRRAALQRFAKMAPPRVMTSQGEVPVVTVATDHLPVGSLSGSPVSAGVVEGVARVVRDPQTEMLQPGEILVAPFTDPGWTPLFINAAGLVMEVGGLMTHGSVVAREYGIPAVVGVIDATTRIQTGQRVRVHGDGGYVELL